MYGDEELTKEALLLKAKAEEAKEVVNKRNAAVFSSSKKKLEESSGVFFKSCLSGFSLTKEMEFVLQCYLLSVTRQPYKRLENGVVLTRTEMSLLSKLSKRITLLDTKSRRKITEVGQKELSASSVALLREEAEKITLFETEEKTHMFFMLSEEMTRVWTPDIQYESKTFGCLFYEYKAILALLREDRALVGFRSIVKEGKPFLLLFQPLEKKDVFSVVADEAYSSLDNKTPLVVFEGVTSLERELFGKWMISTGFSTVILACGAIEAPYERTSELTDIKDKAAVEEILLYRSIYKEKVEASLLLDHVYCNTLLEELESV